LNKRHYIKLAKDYIDKSIAVINDPKSFDIEEEHSQIVYETSKCWLELLNGDEALAEDVENLLTTIYDGEISEIRTTFYITGMFPSV